MRKKMTKKDVDILMGRCIKLVQRKPPEFFNMKKLRGAWGYCYWISLEMDPRRAFISTSIHECVHYLEPDWSESQVLYAESRIINRADFFDIAKFLKYLSTALYKNELRKRLKNQRDTSVRKILKRSKI